VRDLGKAVVEPEVKGAWSGERIGGCEASNRQEEKRCDTNSCISNLGPSAGALGAEWR